MRAGFDRLIELHSIEMRTAARPPFPGRYYSSWHRMALVVLGTRALERSARLFPRCCLSGLAGTLRKLRRVAVGRQAARRVIWVSGKECGCPVGQGADSVGKTD